MAKSKTVGVKAMNRKKNTRTMYLLMFLCITFVGHSGPSRAEDSSTLGRFFTTSKERAELNRLRDNYRPNEEGEIEAPQRLEVKGYVKRHDGVNTVWLTDSTMLHRNPNNEELRVDTRRIADNVVKVNVAGKNVRLRPGEVYDESTGEILDSYRLDPATSETIIVQPCLSFCSASALRQVLHIPICATCRALNLNKNPAQSLDNYFFPRPLHRCPAAVRLPRLIQRISHVLQHPGA